MRIRAFGAFVAVAVVALAIVLVGCGPTVPNVVGMRQADAVRALQDAGYKLGEVSLVSTTTVNLGLIAAQNPAAGESARDGSAVDLAICSSDGARVLVPIVTGQSQTTAEGVARTLGLEAVIHEQYSEDGPEGEVVGQIPDPGAEVNAGSKLVMIVSKGAAPSKGKVPDVKGDREADAIKAIEDAGFVAKKYTSFNSDVARGSVIGQVPDPGTELTKGSQVKIVVSLGAGTGAVKVPSVTGRREADAKTAIEKAGFKMRKVTQYDSSVSRGVVAAQFPNSGATAARGSEVLVVVSLGAEPAGTIAVPDVMGQLVESASVAIEEAGLTAKVQEVPGEADPGTIVYQFPTAGTKVVPGSEVLIVSQVAP